MIGTIEYIILTLANYDAASLSEIEKYCENIIQFARHNSDKTKCILKFTTKGKPIPECILTKTRYNKKEIAQILEHKEWL